MTTRPPAGGDDPDESLDPSDWDSFRALAHAALDDAVDYVRTIRERPVWTPVPRSVQEKLDEPLPVEPQGLPAAYRDLKELVLPYPVGNLHPRFFGWVHGAGAPVGVVAEMIAATLNANCGGRDHQCVRISTHQHGDIDELTRPQPLIGVLETAAHIDRA